MAPPNLHIGNRVRSARLARGLSQEALAHEVGVSTSTIYRLEAGHVPKVSTMVAIASILEISLDDALRPVQAA